MNDNFSEYSNLIRSIEAVPQTNTPSDFTQRIMERLPEQDTSMLSKLKQAWFEFNFGWDGETGAVSKTEGSFYYFIIGFFYLIIGIVVLMGFKSISSGMETMSWIGLQPYLAIGIAILFFTLGGLLMIDGSAGIKAARYGTLFYIFSTVVNGVLIRSYLHIPYAGIFIVGIVGTSVFMGVMLVQSLQKIELRPM